MDHEVVLIGGSSGSLEALEALLPRLPADYDLPVVIALHQHRRTRDDLASVIGRWASIPTWSISDKDRLIGGRIHVCPADYHVLVEADGTLALSTDRPVNLARPSIDVFFESAAHVLGERGIGVLLSGASADGAKGLAAIHAHGGKTACQDPATAREPAMPRAGCAATAVDWIAGPEGLGMKLAQRAEGAG